MKNEMKMEIAALSTNEGLARVAVASFMSCLNPTLEDVEDVKTAVSEAVTNCIIHGYGAYDEKTDMEKADMEKADMEGCGEERNKTVYIECRIEGDELTVCIKDNGVGIEDISQAMEPLFTTRPELERSGMGFAFMEAFMDGLSVESGKNAGTSVTMKKRIPYTRIKEEF